MKPRTSFIIFLVVGLLLIIPWVAAENTSHGVAGVKDAYVKVANTSSGPKEPLVPSVMSPVNQPEWSGWVNLGQVQTTGTPYFRNASPAVVARMPNRLDVFAFNTSDEVTYNNTLTSFSWDGVYWLSDTDVFHPLKLGYNPVTATSFSSDEIVVYANGDDPGKLYSQMKLTGRGWDPEGWLKPDRVDFLLYYGPSAVSPTNTTQYVFWVSPDQHVRYLYWDLAPWQYTYTTTGGYNGTDLGTPPGLTITSAPAAVKYLTINGDVVVFARASDNGLWYIGHWTSGQGTWSSWGQVPGSFNLAGAPAAVSRYPGCIDVVYRTDAGKIVLREYTDAHGWSGETILDQYELDSDPAIASWDPARLDLFIEHGDGTGTIWHSYWNSPKPQITTISPSSIMAGSIDTTITITGNNFYPNSEVRQHLAGTPLLATTFVDEHTLRAVVPESWLTTPGSIPVYVNVPGTTQSNFFSADYTITVTAKSNLPTDKIGVTNGQQWYLDIDGSGTWNPGDKADNFGAPGWTPVVGDWNPAVPGTKTGVYKDGVWYLDWNCNGAWDNGVDYAYSFGAPGWTPVVGKWS